MTDFNNYATKHMGIGSNTLHGYQTFQSVLPMVTNSVTPNIVEERQLNVAMLSVFDRLMMDRIIWCAGTVDDRMSIIVQAQLLYLSQVDSKKPITIHVDSPGGSVKSGLGIVDVMSYIPNPIQTINTGMAASMGSVLLGAGTKGMRSSLRFSKTMLHQSSGGVGGNIEDARITMVEWEKTNKILFDLLGEYCDKDPKQIIEDAQRDLWLDANEAKNYGIIDEVILPIKKSV